MKRIVTILCLLSAGLVQAVEVNATLDWANRHIAAFAVHGVVDAVNVAVGDQVKKNQPLAQLDQTPFIHTNKKNQAHVDGIKPRLFDAKQNYDQAQELYDRTVLSQVELQRAEVQFQGVEAEQLAAKAELEISRWQQKQSILNAMCDCLVIGNTLLPGMVINNENQAVAMIELAETGVLNADIILDKNINLVMQQTVQVNVEGKNYPARVVAISVQNGKRQARIQFRFDTTKNNFAGQAAKVIF